MRKSLIVIVALLAAAGGFAQSSYNYRYWFDEDYATLKTGSATGETQLSVDASRLSLHDLHTLHVQASKSDGRWSATRTTYFVRAAAQPTTAVTGRYWLDNDLSTLQKTIAASGMFEVKANSLSAGVHAIHYQTFAADGTASAVQTRYFLLTGKNRQQLTCALWIDGDEDGAQTFEVTADEEITLDVSALTAGEHELTATLFDDAGCYLGRSTVTFMKDPLRETITLTPLGGGSVGGYCSQNDLDLTDVTGLKAYIASGYDTGTILMTRVYKIPAGTGILLMGEGEKHKVPIADVDLHCHYANLMKGVEAEEGVVAPTTDDYTNFLFTNGPKGLAFYPLAEATSATAGSIYLSVPTQVLSENGELKLLFFDREGLRGDVNGDGKVSIADAVSVVNIILGQ